MHEVTPPPCALSRGIANQAKSPRRCPRFFENYNARTFQEAAGLAPNFVQDNHSRSSGGGLRGIHYQLLPHAQGKLVRVVNGAVFDVAVDIRKSSSTFGKWVGNRPLG